MSRGPLSAASGFGSVSGSAAGSDGRVAPVVDRRAVDRAGGFGFGAGSVAAGSSVFAVSTGVSVGFGNVVVVLRGVGRRPRAVRGAGVAGITSSGVSVTAGLGDSTGLGAGVGSGSAGTVATSVSGGGG